MPPKLGSIPRSVARRTLASYCAVTAGGASTGSARIFCRTGSIACMNCRKRSVRQRGTRGRPISRYSARPSQGRKKMKSSQPFAASGERRVGTMGSMTRRIAQSLATNSAVQ